MILTKTCPAPASKGNSERNESRPGNLKKPRTTQRIPYKLDQLCASSIKEVAIGTSAETTEGFSTAASWCLKPRTARSTLFPDHAYIVHSSKPWSIPQEARRSFLTHNAQNRYALIRPPHLEGSFAIGFGAVRPGDDYR